MTPPNQTRGPQSKRPARQLGDYELLDELGRGGMGVVYRARQVSLGRQVALKVLPSFASMEPAAVARFRREAEASARLSHPGIVPVYGVGESEGTHFYAMELVEGPSLADLVDRLRGRVAGRLLGSLAEETGVDHAYPALKDPPGEVGSGARYARSCAALIADVANALAAAHAGRIIHRDIKPSNVMIHKSGRPVLLDFGLARDEMAGGLTRTGDTVGTPSYMAPEQACGRKDVDARVDVYGLGAALYELLTLRPPFEGAHAGEIMRKILDEEPVPVSRLNARVPLDLETIVHTCLAKNPDRRYPAIEALELDLRAFLVGRAVDARPPTAKERAARFVRRNRRAAWVGVATLVVAAGIGVTAGVIADRRATEQGLGALRDARVQLLEQSNVLKAEESFGRAEALLEDPGRVAQARRDLAIEAFETLYPRGEFDVLARFFSSIPAAERGALAHYVERVEGRGRLVLAVPPADVHATTTLVRRVHGGRLVDAWAPLPNDRRLPIGAYLVRIQREDGQTIHRVADVRRDAECEVAVDWRPADAVPEGMVELHDRDGTPVGVSITEVSCGEYASFLDSIEDPLLRGEMTPSGFDTDASPNQPMRGLSFRQARALAAHRRMHLLSEREFRLAATSGAALDYPWGGAFDPALLVADPDQRSEPDPVFSGLPGASPAGVVHLLGNVAEILSPGPDGGIPLAGGHYQSPPAELGLRRDGLLAAMDAAGTEHGYAGTRLARFLPAPAQPERVSRARDRRREIAGAPTSVVHDWLVGSEGDVRYRLAIRGVHRATDSLLEFPLVTTGFIQLRSPTVRDGHDQLLEASTRGPTHRETTDLAVRMPAGLRRGQGYAIAVDSWLLPVDGLVGEADSYVLRIPVKAYGAFPTVHRVVLPPGSRVEASDPAPTTAFEVEGNTEVIWEFLPDERGSRTIPAVVRFRVDGPLTGDWPVHRRLEQFKDELFEDFATGNRRGLAERVHNAYLQRPSGLDYRAVLARAAGDHEARRFGTPAIVDYTAVGPIATLDLVAEWTAYVDGKEVPVVDWPLRLQIARESGRLRALRLMPVARPDFGVILADGTYRHPGMKVVIQPEDAQVNRTQDGLTEMQVTLTPPGGAAEQIQFQVLGMRARPGQPEDEMRVWLTGGAIALRSGGRVHDSKFDLVGPPGRQVQGESRHWMFRDGRGRWTRARWTFVTKGLRHFLVKSVATGGSEPAAKELFARRRAWFDKMAAAVEIE